MNTNLKIVSYDNDTDVLFHIPTYSVLKVRKDSSGYSGISNELSNYLSVQERVAINPPKRRNRERLGGLILNATEKCNLACTYCMVSQGTYRNETGKKKMDFEDYVRIFQFVLTNYSQGVAFVCFFGGEPMICKETIRQAILCLNKMCDERNVKRPRYSIITNGTVMDYEMVDFLNEQHVFLSISTDGLKELHDSARIFPNGKGSFNTIRRNLEFIDGHGRKFPLYGECTIHKKHLDIMAGHETQGGYEFIKSIYALGFDTVYVFPVDSKEPELSIDSEQYYLSMEKFLRGVYDYYMDLLFSEDMKQYPPGHFIGVFSNIFAKRLSKFCNVGNNTLFVNPQGELYPCHLLYNSRYKKLGSIEKGFFNYEKDMDDLYESNNRLEVSNCKACINRHLCFLWCAGSSMLSNNRIDTTIRSRCNTVDITVNYVLKQIISLHKDKERAEIFRRNIRKCVDYYKSYDMSAQER